MLCKPFRLAYLLGGVLAVTLTFAPALAQDEKPSGDQPAEKKADKDQPADNKKPADKAKEEKAAKDDSAKKEDAAKKDDSAKKEDAAKKDKAAEEKKADEKKGEKEQAGPKAVTLVTNLLNPTGIAINEKSGDIFIASRYGVYRYDPVAHTTPNIEIVGMPVDVYGSGPKYDISPLGVAFLNETTLIVGGGGREDAEELVHVFTIGEKPSNPSLTEKDAAATLGPIKKGAKTALGEPTTKGEGNFYDVAVGPAGVYISSNGDDTKGWILHIDVKDGKLAKELVPTIATKVDSGTDAPVPIEYSLDGKKLYVGQMGEVSLPGDAKFLVYDAKTGKLQQQFELDLNDPAGLAVSPKTKKIYVTDFAWAKPEQAGLYEIVIDGDKATTKKILSLDKPTDIEFDKNGKLYVTVAGTLDEKAKTEDGEQLSPGKLLVIDAGL